MLGNLPKKSLTANTLVTILAFLKNVFETKIPTKTHLAPKPNCFAHRICFSTAHETVYESIPNESLLVKKKNIIFLS